MTLWGMHGQIQFNHKRAEHDDCHQNVTETSGHRTTQIHGPHRNCEPGYSSVTQSSRDITHGPLIMDCAAHWQHIMCFAGHMRHLYQAGMD